MENANELYHIYTFSSGVIHEKHLGWRHRGTDTTIDLIHKSQNAPVPYHRMLHSEQKCKFVLNGALWDMEQVHSGICE